MSYLALARKYRPQTFETIVSQSFITTTIQNAIKLNRVAHAYLFTGPRGVGKTTTARIFAKAINCLNPKNATPCDECDNCIDITNGTSIDVIEIDGASNRGVDDIRDLRETVNFVPVKSKYKVYIIDEVHMLTKEAFNALLKTLEEPPSFVMFIFATTDPHKIPATILSRCQRYEFTKIPHDEMVAKIVNILETEKIEYDMDAINLAARNSDGCMRDSLSIVDQIIAYSGGKVDYESAAFLLGISDKYLADEAFAAMIKEQPDNLPEIIKSIDDKGLDLKYVTECLVEHTRNLLMYIVVGRLSDKDFSKNEQDYYSDLKKYASKNRLYALFQVLDKLANDMKYCDFAKYVFEFALFKGASLSQIIPLTKADIPVATTQPEKKVSVPLVTESVKAADVKPITEIIEDNATNNTEPINEILSSEDVWKKALKIIHEKGGLIEAHIAYGSLISATPDKILIGFTPDRDFQYEYFNKPENKIKVQNIIDSIAKPAPKFDVSKTNTSDGKKKVITTKSSPVQAESYKERKVKNDAIQQPLVQEIIKSMDGVVESVEMYNMIKDDE